MPSAYFKTSAMKNDGEHDKYTWDAFGRLRKVLNRSNDNLVAEYTDNGLGFRITEHQQSKWGLSLFSVPDVVGFACMR